MPHAWTTWMPWRSSYAFIREGGQAEPPMKTSRRQLTSRGLASSSASSPCQTVGTAAAMVGRSRSIISASGSGWRKRSGMSIEAPAMKAACAVPHAFAWNMGTTGSRVSPPDIRTTRRR